jgi:HPt (histidine-containing phosphotransfer) domain-containing protein
MSTAQRRWLPGREPGSHALKGGANTAVLDDGPDDVLDATTVHELIEGLTPEMHARLLEDFDQTVSECVADIETAARGHKPADLRRLTHMLNGISATLGANRLCLYCQQLEHKGRDGDPLVGESQLRDLRTIAAEARQALREQML